eukprot:COSAG04_NODE_1928_length_5201_cov_4.970600_4_plen_31_part_00
MHRRSYSYGKARAQIGLAALLGTALFAIMQ